MMRRCPGRLLWLAVAAVACSSPTVPADEPGLVGVIVRAGPGLWSGDPEGPFQVHVKADPEEECGIIFTIHSSTSITDSRSAEGRPASQSVLTVGARVAVWFGLVLQSCPGQSGADAIDRRG